MQVVALLNPDAHNPGVSVWIVVFSAVQLLIIQVESLLQHDQPLFHIFFCVGQRR